MFFNWEEHEAQLCAEEEKNGEFDNLILLVKDISNF